MRAWFMALSVLTTGCASAVAQPTREASESIPVWRIDTRYLEQDRERARRCLFAAARSCADEIQDDCTGGDGGEGITPAVLRACDWRAIAAWEDEIEVLLGRLREQMRGRDLENLETSQRAWEASMLADVRAAMEFYEGGSLAGPAGAHVRAYASAQRARYLADLLLMTGE